MEFVRFKDEMTKWNILEILEKLSIDFEVKNKTSLVIDGVANGLFQIDKTLYFRENIKNIEQIMNTPNSLIITNTPASEIYHEFHLIYVEDPRFVFIKLLEYCVHQCMLENFSTIIEYKERYLSNKANIHPSVILEDNVIIEEGVVVSAGCVIKNGTYIGKNTIIRENCVIGCDGIALYKAKNDEVLRFPHVAGVFIGENVEIGANCVVVGGTLANTIVESNTVIGNLCNIGHGVRVGKKVWISVGGMIGGNCTIEDNVTIGLGVSLKDNLKIARGSTIGMGSVVTKNLNETTTVFGNPAKSMRPLNVGPKR